jgi:L-erythro-3,5-diaminohexanoate dehydrogenase
VGDRIATLVSLTLTPLRIDDALSRWDGRSEQVPCDGHAILFGRSIAAHLPGDLPAELALAVMDVCGAPALTHGSSRKYVAQGRPPSWPSSGERARAAPWRSRQRARAGRLARSGWSPSSGSATP